MKLKTKAMHPVPHGTNCGHCERPLNFAMVAHDGKHFCTNFCVEAYKIAKRYEKELK